MPKHSRTVWFEKVCKAVMRRVLGGRVVYARKFNRDAPKWQVVEMRTYTVKSPWSSEYECRLRFECSLYELTICGAVYRSNEGGGGGMRVFTRTWSLTPGATPAEIADVVHFLAYSAMGQEDWADDGAWKRVKA